MTTVWHSLYDYDYCLTSPAPCLFVQARSSSTATRSQTCATPSPLRFLSTPRLAPLSLGLHVPLRTKTSSVLPLSSL